MPILESNEQEILSPRLLINDQIFTLPPLFWAEVRQRICIIEFYFRVVINSIFAALISDGGS